MLIERVIFMDNDDADEAFAILDREGKEATVKHLVQWHNPGEHETSDTPAAGSLDWTYRTDDGYILTYNRHLNYIGLEYVVREGD